MRPIDADALISEIKKDTKKAIEQDDFIGSFWLGYIAGLVIKQPSIQPEVLACGNGELVAKPEPHEGHWIRVAGMNECCSACNKYFPLSYFTGRPFDINYCPNCGAKMKGERQK